MSHVHWWLFGLSFAIGFALTFASIVGPVRRRSAAAGKPDPSTTKIVADPPTTRIVADPPTTRIAVDPPTTKIQAKQDFSTTKIPVSPLAPYGPGSANPGPGGAGPPGWLVKGRMDTKLYYTPDDPSYDPTVAQVWFIDEESAVRAHFTPWRER
ncbi:membrane protein [Mycobacterium rhizamassiliense]|jgi:uncharacterized membrane protein ArfC|uniref:Membrane protein n=1 Tax=Mycobacterium rhizamassiliense TaxID=1841860 RepID=A0A2U3NT96_9MYCO|nr:hypothetical protein [Mycobacterium rhizamassiliense]SPM34732.1 membrane protein [Mycobacterium rhizamassiliense]